MTAIALLPWLVAAAGAAGEAGAAVNAEKGPDPSWRLTVPGPVDQAVIAGRGLLVAATDKELFGVLARTVTWKKRIVVRSLLADESLACVVVLAGSEVSCFDPKSGKATWRVTHPKQKDAGEDRDLDSIVFLAAAVSGGRIVLLDGAGRMFSVDERSCAKASTACMSASGKLSDAVTKPHLSIFPSGDRAVLDGQSLHLTDGNGKETAKMSFSAAAPPAIDADGTMLLAYERVVDDAKCSAVSCKKEWVLGRINPRKCAKGTSRDPITRCGVALGKPDSQNQFFRSPPIPLRGGDVIVDVGELQRWGKTRWKANLGTTGFPVLEPPRLHLTAREGAEGKLELRAIDIATGKTTQRSWVPGGGGRNEPGILVDGAPGALWESFRDGIKAGRNAGMIGFRDDEMVLFLFAGNELFAYPITSQ